jgi:Trypsin-co-occurring domain 2
MRGGAMSDDELLPLADFVAALRSELRLASEHGQDQEPRFVIGPVTVDFTVVVRRELEGRAGIRFYVIELGGQVGQTRETTQRVSLTLTPTTTTGEPYDVRDRLRSRPD